MSLLENVCNKSGLPNNVFEGGPFLPSRVRFLVGSHSSLSWGGGDVCLWTGNPLFSVMHLGSLKDNLKMASKGRNM